MLRGFGGTQAKVDTWQRLERWLLAHVHSVMPLVVASIAALQTSYLLTWSVRELTERGVAMDDSYFYAVLARNYDKVGFLTFDGTMPTNGVQPLWQWAVIGLHQAFPAVELMRASFAANWLLYAVFSWLAVRHALRVSSEDRVPRASAVSLLLICNPAFQAIVLRGMEVPLFLASFSGLLNLLEDTNERWRANHPGSWRTLLVGVLAGITFLARTDWFWVVPLGAIFVWSRSRRWTSAVVFVAAAGLLVIPYLVHNWAVHGHVMPISGRTKLVLLDLHTTGILDYLQSDEWHGVFSLVGAIFGLKPLWLAIPLTAGLVFVGVRRFSFASSSVRFLLVATACHTLFMHLVYREVRPYTNYYFGAEGIAAAYLFAEAAALGVSFLRRRLQPRTLQWSYRGACCAVVLLLVGTTLAFHATDARDKWVWRWQMAEHLRSLPPHEKVAAFWPGAFAYVSERSVFPLDGIVGSEAYLDVVRDGREFEYTRSRDIDYVVVADLPPESIHAPEPPKVKSWAELGKLRLWQNCAFVSRLVAKRGSATKRDDAWYLYELSDVPGNAQCQVDTRLRTPAAGLSRL